MILTSKNVEKHTVGGKAAALCRLVRMSGVAVPPFVMLPVETFEGTLKNTPESEAACRQLLFNFQLPVADQEALAQVLSGWNFPQQPVVVRSSVADEDGGTEAFAGLMDSFLNLTTLPQVYAAIARCAASAYSERAMAYRRQKGLTLQPRPAVLVQQQITPVASGVLFTTFPEYPQEGAIHAVFGFGEGLVNGALQPDEFYYGKATRQVHRQVIAAKEEVLIRNPAGGLLKAELPAAEKSEPCLSAAQTQALAETGTALENAFGCPQDVEFVVTAEQLFIVQSRPITQFIPEVVVYDNSNIQESYCGVTTPLTFSFATRAYATVYRQTMQTLGLSEKVIQAHEPVVTNLLGLVKGRIYYNINNWYRGLQLLPSFRQNKADMERMMGLEEPVDFVANQQKTLLQKVQVLPRMLQNMVRLLWSFNRLKVAVPRFHQKFKKHFQVFYAQLAGPKTAPGLWAQKEELDRALLNNWTIPIINDFWVMMNNGAAVRNLRRRGISDPEEFLSRYLSGDAQIESTQPVKEMQLLAEMARKQPELQHLILEAVPSVHSDIEIRFPSFHQSVNHFINAFGDRTVGELKLETRTMRLDPQVFYRYLKNYLSAEMPAAAQAPFTLREQAEEELKMLLQRQSVWARRKMQRQLKNLQQAIRYRESLRLERTRLFGMYRALYLNLGDQFEKEGFLETARDIFYLTEAEIGAAVSGSETATFKENIPVRQREFAGYRSEEVPSRVVVPAPPIEPPATVLGEHQLQGSGCVPGIVSGEVIVIRGPEDSLDVQGKIVCALRTDPGWAVLFPTCKAVLIEKGSSLSHSVILLRELGIPTVINIPGLTHRLKTGDTVQLDGRTGKIDLLGA
jgi:pyruvate,water dikinase